MIDHYYFIYPKNTRIKENKSIELRWALNLFQAFLKRSLDLQGTFTVIQASAALDG